MERRSKGQGRAAVGSDKKFTRTPIGKTSRRSAYEEAPRAARRVKEVDRKTVETSDEILSGRHPVLEALKAGRPMNKLLLAEGAEGGSLAEIIARAKESGIVIQNVPRASLTRLAGERHQGIVAYVSPRAYAEVDEIVARETGQIPLVLILDEVEDPHNLGAILRTADATGVQGVIIPKRRAVPLTGTVAKAAAGALEYVPVARVSNLVQTMEYLKKQGYWIVGASVGAEHRHTEVDMTGKIALVIGAEGKGLGRLVESTCDHVVSLPMMGQLQSLNASVAAGVMLYEAVRQRS